jgi:low temperature requirement protein LtrA
VHMARDSYAYLHLPMIAGVVLVALGVKKTLADVDEPLKTVPAAALYGGAALYLAANVAFRLRNVHNVSVLRLVVAGIFVALIPPATEVDAAWALAAATAILTALIAYETMHFREARARLRAAG